MGHMDIEELRDATIAELARKHAAAIRKNVLQGHAQTMRDLGNAVGDRLCDNDLMAQLVRASMVGGALMAGTLMTDTIQRCIDADAEHEALKEVERMERDRAADPASFRAKRRVVAEFAERAA